MMFVAKKEGRIASPVVLRVKLEAVSRPGVMFSDCNSTRHDAVISEHPGSLRFDVVKAKNCFAVPELLRHFYQAEILVPSPLPTSSHSRLRKLTSCPSLGINVVLSVSLVELKKRGKKSRRNRTEKNRKKKHSKKKH